MIDHDYTPTTLHSHQCQAPECIPPELLDICHLGNNISLAKSMFDISLFIQNPEKFFSPQISIFDMSMRLSCEHAMAIWVNKLFSYFIPVVIFDQRSKRFDAQKYMATHWNGITVKRESKVATDPIQDGRANSQNASVYTSEIHRCSSISINGHSIKSEKERNSALR